MSPVIPDYFFALRSMQNAQALDHTNGLANYVVKYISKFDETNYTTLCQDSESGDFVMGRNHLHNTKVVRSKINEDKYFARQRAKNHPKGREHPHLEIRQMMLGHEEVFTNLDFVEICTLPFELRKHNAIKLNIVSQVVDRDNNSDQNAADNNYENTNNNQSRRPPDSYLNVPLMKRIREELNLQPEQLMTPNQVMTYKNQDGKAGSYDKISIFSLRPPELLNIFTNIVDYFRLCYICEDKIKERDLNKILDEGVRSCCWIDCLGRKVKIRILGLDEIKSLLQNNTRYVVFAQQVKDYILYMIETYQ